jgi:hypothetical protein
MAWWKKCLIWIVVLAALFVVGFRLVEHRWVWEPKPVEVEEVVAEEAVAEDAVAAEAPVVADEATEEAPVEEPAQE